MLLWNRVSVAAGVQNQGHVVFWQRAWEDLGLSMSSGMVKNLEEKDYRLLRQRTKSKTMHICCKSTYSLCY
eukprot:8963799-Ditylum_brightwellii.AAC.1